MVIRSGARRGQLMMAAVVVMAMLPAVAAAQVDLDGAGPAPKGKPRAAPARAPAADGGDAKEDAAAKEAAQALVQSGVKLLRQKDYLGALAVFRGAYQRFPSVKLLLNIGTTLRLLERDADAANTYQRYLDDPDADAARSAEVEAALLKLDRGVGRVQIKVVGEVPDGAQLSFGDDEWSALRAGPVRVAAGPFTVRARGEGFEPFEVTGEAVAGQAQDVEVRLVATPVVEEVVAPSGPSPEELALAQRRARARQPRSRLGLMLRGHFHLSPAGAAALIGPTVDVTRRVEVNAGVLLGRFRGGYLGSSYAFLPGRLRPLLSAGLLLIVDDGARIAVRGAGGVEVMLNRNLSLFAELGGEHLFNPAMTVFANAFVPSAGVFGRL